MALDLFSLCLQVERLDLERLLVDGAGQVAIEQAVLHARQFGAALGKDALLLGLDGADLVEASLQRVAEPLGMWVRQSHRVQFLLDGVDDLRLTPANPRMAIAGVIVAAAVIDVLVAAAAVELAADELARHGEVAAGAAENAAGEGDVRVARPPVAAVQNVLADVEHLAVDQQAISTFEHLTIAFEFADVEAVVEDVR